MRTRRELPIQIKTPAQLAVMREAGLVVARTLDVVTAAVEPGISTAELDAIAEREIRGAGAVPSFKGYHGYPATICTSVNDQIVHGIPSDRTRLAAGDLISIDCGAIVGGWHGDAARTIGVGPISDELTRLLQACERALWAGLAQARPGRRLSDISHAVETSARASGRYGIIREYVGHGIGTEMHMDPPVPNYGRPGRGPVLTEGMALAIEPMLVLGRPETRVLDDDWTVVTADGTWSAHFEHTVAITADGPWVLTAGRTAAGGREPGSRALSGLTADRAAAPDRRGAGHGCGADGDLRACRRRDAPSGAEEDLMASSDPRIRASDEDRDRAATLLREHHAAGRLTAEEFNERLDKVYEAKTLGDLDELMSDLPAIDLYRLPDASLHDRRPRPGAGSGLEAVARSELAHRHGRFSPAWQAAWGSWFSISLLLFVIWALSGAGYVWPLWVAGPLGAILLGRWITGSHPGGKRRHDHGPDTPHQ